MFKWIFCFFIFSLFACGEPAVKFNGFEKMLGSWKAVTKDGVFYESWKQENNKMVGTGFMLHGTDTSFGEKLIVEFVNDKLVYIADVKGQDPVTFTEGNANDPLQFFNSEHDFPNHISYGFWPEGNKVTVVLTGLEEGKEAKEEFIFNKITNE